MDDYARLRAAIADRPRPLALVDLDRFDANAAALERRADGMPIRVASKSVRCVALLRRVLARPGWHGVLAFSAAEAAHLCAHGFDDVLVAYPCVERAQLLPLVRHACDGAGPILMVDDAVHVRLAAEVAREHGVTFELAIDLDVALDLPGLYFGVRRSPIRDVDAARRLGELILREEGVSLVAAMGYEAQIAGLPDATGAASDLAIRALKRASFVDVARRRGAIVHALREQGHPIRIVNGGGTGSLEVTRNDTSVSELAAGSGLFGPTSFDAFASFRPEPAAAFALGVTRIPKPGLATCFGGGYVASGPAGDAKLPRPWLPEGLALLPHEGAGEVQTPLRVPRDVSLHVGDPVFFRHAKAGELCERFATLLLISDDRVVDEVPTYRGEGACFG
jgi:D-serine deaminase-like pyridoxal phosphate-dependent protein